MWFRGGWLVVGLFGGLAAASAAPHWGDFKDDGCVDPEVAPGVRQYSAILWGIPPGQSWEAACAKMPATFEGHRFAHPALCVNTNANPTHCVGIAWGKDFKGVFPRDCWTQGHGAMVRSQATVRPWVGPYPFLPGFVPERARASFKAQLNAKLAAKPVQQFKDRSGGLNMWGVFLVADADCLPKERYVHLPPPAPWQVAVDYCANRGLVICDKEHLCEGGRPVLGSPPGDVWVAVGSAQNNWVSVGAALPERICKDHVEVAGSKPAWGTASGPQAVTGHPTALRCCLPGFKKKPAPPPPPPEPAPKQPPPPAEPAPKQPPATPATRPGTPGAVSKPPSQRPPAPPTPAPRPGTPGPSARP